MSREPGPVSTALPADPATSDVSTVRHLPVVVVGGGQAGLAMSWLLCARGVEHVVLERESVAHSWADARWDAFCLVTPNRQCHLPGRDYTGDDPDGFMVREEVVAWLADYRASFDPPVRERTRVTSVREHEGGQGDGHGDGQGDGHGTPRFQVVAQGPDGPFELSADAVVVATGGYHAPRVPDLAHRLPDHLVQVHSSAYRAPDQLPPGDVLVVGTGQSGAQIAEDLHRAGRGVHLAVGSAPRVARRYRGRDVMTWLQEAGQYDLPVTDKPPAERFRDKTNHYVTGRDGGHDIDLRAFASEGMVLHGHLVEVERAPAGAPGGPRRVLARFADDLTAHLDGADAVMESIKDLVDAHISARGLDAPTEQRYRPAWAPEPGPSSLDLSPGSATTSVVWTTGFRREDDWLEVGVFDGAGHPRHVRGVTGVPGLLFLGLPWMHTWGSGRFLGLRTDAEHLAAHLDALLDLPPAPDQAPDQAPEQALAAGERAARAPART